WRPTSSPSRATRSRTCPGCGAFATSCRAAGSWSATAGRWSEASSLGAGVLEGRDHRVHGRLVEVLGIQAENPGLGLVVAHDDDRVGRSESANHLDGAPTVG